MAKMGKMVVFAALLAGMLTFAGPSAGFLPDPEEKLQHLYNVDDKSDLYYYENKWDRCYMLIGKLHGRTVSISCVKK
jgi:hypothetical protein